MIASLDMYNWPESKAAFDLFWSKMFRAHHARDERTTGPHPS